MKFEAPTQPENYRDDLAGKLKELRAKEEGPIEGPIKNFLGISGKQKAEKLLNREKETDIYKEQEVEKATDLSKEKRKEKWVKLGDEAMSDEKHADESFPAKSKFYAAFKFYKAAGDKEGLTKLGDEVRTESDYLAFKCYKEAGDKEGLTKLGDSQLMWSPSISKEDYDHDERFWTNDVGEKLEKREQDFKYAIKYYKEAENTWRLIGIAEDNIKYRSSAYNRSNFKSSFADLAYKAIEEIYLKDKENGKMTPFAYDQAMKYLGEYKNKLILQRDKDAIEIGEEKYPKDTYVGRGSYGPHSNPNSLETPQSITDLKRKHMRMG